jgi:hypothetical protein
VLYRSEIGVLMSDYYSPGYAPPVPGADWFINGRRYREVVRCDFSDTASEALLEFVEES